MSEQAKFLEGNLMRHIAVMSLTASVGLMAVFIVDFVDMIFISWLGKDELAAAIGYAGAILFFTTSFGIGMAIAAGALVARALGAGDGEKARQQASHALIYAVVFGALFAFAVWLNLEALAALMGASGETLVLAVEYLQIIVPSLPFLMVGMIGGAILRAHGDARRAMMATVWGGVVNAVLDPILIFGLDMELAGAAWASVAARITIGVTAIIPIYRHHGGLEPPDLKGLALDLRPVLLIAFPAILTQLATPIGQAYVTRSMAAYGEQAVAGMAIVGRITPVAFGVIFALSGAIGPVIGQNYGAGQHERVRGAFRDGIIFTAVVVLVISALLFGLRGPIAALFEAQGLTLTLVYLFCGPLALTFFFSGAMFVGNAAFNNLGHPYYSTWINWGRHTLGTIPPVILFSAWLGAPGVLIGQALGGVIFGLLTWGLALRVMSTAEVVKVPEKGHFDRQSRLMSLLHLRK
ncbi:Multidrug and toxin extrusion (MATE) family efflux pump YdhE/NorM,-like protein [Candidatus Rhodobacter oscarellae]|uniref:Multidrug and toxin extrusion (MATE) family efflux pump YdhE/NorM,-like protein n=1 Tax=Candidatus Rhodobacter oscarellae TaxID=1675527 RepID=A0A0J9E742_9RHOB|nr:MATE family efflux transporter [Candidatus Rhodobacter lobularis]KMW58517.1 Multidrug and toxin extrusion (MATE) family efflux pump YdhE/NorM,-like protein [Candidatus Rhodobacter lobularis]